MQIIPYLKPPSPPSNQCGVFWEAYSPDLQQHCWGKGGARLRCRSIEKLAERAFWVQKGGRLAQKAPQKMDKAVSTRARLKRFRGKQAKTFFERGPSLRNAKGVPEHEPRRVAELVDIFSCSGAPFRIRLCHMNFAKTDIKMKILLVW